MIDLIQELRKLTEKWRATGQKTRDAATEIPNLLAQGHMHGLSDGLDVAADDVDSLLEQTQPPVDPPKIVD